MEVGALHTEATAEPIAEVERLGDEIAELSAHLEAATARLLELIREFDALGSLPRLAQALSHGLREGAGADPRGHARD